MPLVWALVIGLAAFRIYRIAGVDQITEPFHGRLNASRHPVGMWFSDLVSCPWCIGWWASLALAALGWLVGLFTWQEAIPIAFAASAVCGITGHVTAALQALTESLNREPQPPLTQLWVNVDGNGVTIDGPESEPQQRT
jgi:hypothetical protein